MTPAIYHPNELSFSTFFFTDVRISIFRYVIRFESVLIFYILLLDFCELACRCRRNRLSNGGRMRKPKCISRRYYKRVRLTNSTHGCAKEITVIWFSQIEICGLMRGTRLRNFFVICSKSFYNYDSRSNTTAVGTL